MNRKFFPIYHSELLRRIFLDEDLRPICCKAFCGIIKVESTFVRTWAKKDTLFGSIYKIGQIDYRKLAELEEFKQEISKETAAEIDNKIKEYKKISRYMPDSMRDGYVPAVHIPLLFEVFKEGKTIANFCKEANIDTERFRRWRQTYPELDNAFFKAQTLAQSYWDDYFRKHPETVPALYARVYACRFRPHMPLKGANTAKEVAAIALEGLSDNNPEKYSLSLEQAERVMVIAQKKKSVEIENPVVTSEMQEQKNEEEKDLNEEIIECENALMEHLADLKEKQEQIISEVMKARNEKRIRKIQKSVKKVSK